MWFFFFVVIFCFLREKCNQFSSDSPSPHENKRPAHLDQMVLRHVVRDPPNFIVCSENVIMDLKLLSAVIPVNTHTDSIRWLIFSSTHSEQCRCWTYVMTTGATLLVMMDLPLLLWMLSVWKEALLADRLLSVIPLPWKLSCSVGWGAALAVVPILHWQLSITETHTCITWCFILRTFCFVSLTWLN